MNTNAPVTKDGWACTYFEALGLFDVKIVGIVMTGYGTIDSAVKAMKAGAFDFITKPFDADVCVVLVGKALEFQRLRQNVLLRKTVQDQYPNRTFDRRQRIPCESSWSLSIKSPIAIAPS